MANEYYWALYWLAGLAAVYYTWITENKWAEDEEPSSASKKWIELRKLIDEYPGTLYLVVFILLLVWPIDFLAQIWWTVKRVINKKPIF